MITCAYADLFESCAEQAVQLVRWRRWGVTPYCAHHAHLLTCDNPSDLMEKTPV